MTESEILWENAKFLNYNLTESYIKAGQEIAKEIVKKYGKTKSYTIICGTGGNGGDGLSVAYFLYELGVKDIKTYLVGRGNQLKNKFIEPIWNEVLNFKNELNLQQDCYAKDIESADIVIEALVGTGLEGKALTKRYKDVMQRVSHFGKPIVAIDIPAPHYEANFTYSILYPKHPDAQVIKVNFPKEVELFCGPGEKLALWKPKKSSHKNKNGELLVISDDFDEKLVDDVKKDYPTQIRLSNFYSKNLEDLLSTSDSILISKVEKSLANKAIAQYISDIYTNKTFIFSVETLSLLDVKDFKNLQSKILVLNQKSLTELSKSKDSLEGKLKRFAIENNCVVVFLGFQNLAYNSKGEMRMVRKSVNYDEVLLKIAAYSTKNDLWLSGRAALD